MKGLLMKSAFVLTFSMLLSFITQTEVIADKDRGVAVGMLSGMGFAIAYVLGKEGF